MLYISFNCIEKETITYFDASLCLAVKSSMLLDKLEPAITCRCILSQMI